MWYMTEEVELVNLSKACLISIDDNYVIGAHFPFGEGPKDNFIVLESGFEERSKAENCMRQIYQDLEE